MGGKCGSVLSHAGGKENPNSVTTQVEQDRGNAVCADSCDAAENKGIDKRTDQWIQKNPCRAENSLLTGQGKGALCEQYDQIAVAPDLL